MSTWDYITLKFKDNQMGCKESCVHQLFPVPVYNFSLIDNDFTDVISAVKRKIKYGDVSRGITEDNIHLDNDFSKVVKLIDQPIKHVISTLGIKNNGYEILGMWSNTRTNQYAEHASHSHPNSYLSGVLYVECAEPQTGDIIFERPTGINPYMFDYTNNPSFFLFDDWCLTPKVGTLLIFPSSLRHRTDNSQFVNQSRTSISFNLMPKSSCTKPTKKKIF